MFKRFFGLLILPYHLFACALCALYTPSATVNITLEGDASMLKAITFEWHFSQDFIKTLIVTMITAIKSSIQTSSSASKLF